MPERRSFRGWFFMYMLLSCSPLYGKGLSAKHRRNVLAQIAAWWDRWRYGWCRAGWSTTCLEPQAALSTLVSTRLPVERLYLVSIWFHLGCNRS